MLTRMRIRLVSTTLLGMMAVISPAWSNDRVGAWGPVFDWGLPGQLTTPIHATLVVTRDGPGGALTGKVLTHGYYGLTWSYLWDPGTGAFIRIDYDPGDSLRECGDARPPAATSLFCSGHSVLADGKVLVTGGDLTSPDLDCPNGYAFSGSYYSYLLDPLSPTPNWRRVGDMNRGRWYPTNTVLGDGRVLSFSGLTECGYCDADGNPITPVNPDVELFSPVTEAWRVVSKKELPLYPWMHLLSSGRLSYSGPGNDSYLFNPSNGAWSFVGYSAFPYRGNGTSLLLPTGRDRIMIIGGDCCGEFATRTTEAIDLNKDTPRWRSGPSMHYGRTHANAVLLPDGSILEVGGRSDYGFGGDLAQPVYEAERLDPFARRPRWKLMARMDRPRMYHSTALLLPDGRVLSAGGTAAEGFPNDETNGQVYSPPYLFKGPRPMITSAPEQVGYGATFIVQTPAPNEIALVVMMRPSSVTHSFDQEQRYVRLSFTVSGSELRVRAPADGNTAPPGYYMLFIVNRDRVPSMAAFVKLGP